MTDTRDMQQRDLVLYLERMLESARRGEVQIFIAASARLPFTPDGWGALEVEPYACFGSLAARLDEASLRGGYAKTLEGLAIAAGGANQGFERMLARFEPVLPPDGGSDAG